MARLACLALIATSFLGCASASEQDHSHADAAVTGSGDGSNGTDAAPLADARPDAPTDAPASSCAMPFSGVLVSWDFSGETGSQTATAAGTAATGVTAGSVSRAAGLTAVSGSGSINASNWPTAAQLDPTKYYTLSLTPPSGCTLALTMLAVDAKSSGTGPASAVVATSADGFAQTAPVSTTAASTPTLTVSGETGMVELRIYGYAATGTAGTMRLQNTLSLTGTLQ